jgi:hypothetical protein
MLPTNAKEIDLCCILASTRDYIVCANLYDYAEATNEGLAKKRLRKHNIIHVLRVEHLLYGRVHSPSVCVWRNTKCPFLQFRY